MLTGGKILGGLPLHDRAFRPVAARPLQIELHPFAPAEAAHRAGVSCHASLLSPVELVAPDRTPNRGVGPTKSRSGELDPPPLWRPAAIERDRRRVRDRHHLNPARLQGANRHFPAGPGTLHEYVDLAQAMLHRFASRRFGGHLSGVGRALAAPLEPVRPRT